MRHRLVVWSLGWAVLGGSACLSGDERRQGAGTDVVVTSPTDATTATSSPDVVGTDSEESEASTGIAEVSEDVLPPDDTVEPDTVVVTSCDRDEDCVGQVVLGACEAARCRSHTCEAKTVDDGSLACDDGDKCTDDDRCGVQGCAGAPRVCGDVACQTAVECVDGDCVGTPVADGTLCDDGGGQPMGECRAGWYGPADTCKAGVCKGGEFTPPATGHVLSGDWVSIVSTGTNHQLATVRAALALDNAGGLDVGSVAATVSDWTQNIGLSNNTVCLHPEGGTTLQLGGFRYEGYVNPTYDTMVFGGFAANEIGIAVRPVGTRSMVKGRYHLLWTAKTDEEAPQLTTWYGQLDFDDEGCLRENVGVATVPGLGVARLLGAPDEPSCITVDEDQGASLIVGVRDENEVLLDERQWYGAISGRGEVIIMTQSDDAGGVSAYGTIVLVRARSDVGTNVFPGLFGYVHQRDGARMLAGQSSPNLRWGALRLTAPSTVAGYELDTGTNVSPITGGWYTVAPNARYAHRLLFGPSIEHVAGWITPSVDFIAGFVPAGVGGSAPPGPLQDSVEEGGLFLMVRAGVPRDGIAVTPVEPGTP